MLLEVRGRAQGVSSSRQALSTDITEFITPLAEISAPVILTSTNEAWHHKPKLERAAHDG